MPRSAFLDGHSKITLRLAERLATYGTRCCATEGGKLCFDQAGSRLRA